MMKRKNYVDNLRWICILLLIPFHAAMSYNCWGEGNYIFFHENKLLGSFITLISAWYMPLLFLLAGISSYYSLKKRSNRQYIIERVKKLLVPLLIGVVTIVPVMTYYADKFNNNYSGDFFSHYSVFYTRLSDLTGYDGGFTIAHLWFLLYLFVISLVALGINYIFEKNKYIINWNYFTIIILGFILVITKPIFDFNGKSIGLFLTLFLLGYYVFSKDEVISKLDKYRFISLIVFLISNICNIYLFIYSNLSNSLLNVVTNYLTLWFGCLTLLGYGKRYLDFSNNQTKWMSKNCFSFYIIHFVILILNQYYLSRLVDGVSLFILSILVTYIFSFILIYYYSKIKKEKY